MPKIDLDAILPDDILQVDDPAAEFKSLTAQTAEARAKRTDLIGIIALEEQNAGKGGWRERVQLRLSEDGQEPVGLKVISDGAKIFTLFRAKYPTGLGWTRDEIAQYQPGRLRVFAQNYKWAIKNPEKVSEMLAQGANENAMRREIQRLIQEADPNHKPDEVVYENVVFRCPKDEAAVIRSVVDAVRIKRETEHGEVFSEKEGVRAGQALLRLALEWLGYADYDKSGEIVVNQSWLAQVPSPDDATPQESDDHATPEPAEAF